MKVRPTGLGIKAFAFYAVVLFIYLATPYSNLFFLLIAFATVLGLVGVLGAIRNLAGVGARLDGVAPVPAGTPPRLRADVQVGGRGRVGLALGIRFERGPEHCIGAAWTGESGALAGHLPALPRGIHRVRRARLMSTWPLGLVRASRALDMPGEIVVYPAPLDLADGRAVGGEAGDAGVPVSRNGLLQPSGLREFRPGDPLKRVHWRAMARTGHPVVAEWEGGQGDGFEFVLDRRCESTELERSLSVLSTYAQRARDEKIPFTLHTQGLSASFGGGRGQRSRHQLWHFLAGAQVLDAGDAAPPPAGPHVPRLPAPGSPS